MKSRYLVLAAILSTGSLPLLAQDGMPGGNGVAIKAHATNTADKAFIRKATEGSMTEVEFGKIAVAKSNNPEVKNFGQKMIDDHTMLLDGMKPIAAKRNVTPPTHIDAQHKAMANRFKRMSPEAFDKAYVRDMVEDHHEDLAEFKKERDATKDDELKASVVQALDVIQMHSDMIDGIASKNGIKVAAM